jgi:hypothetical protein
LTALLFDIVPSMLKARKLVGDEPPQRSGGFQEVMKPSHALFMRAVRQCERFVLAGFERLSLGRWRG